MYFSFCKNMNLIIYHLTKQHVFKKSLVLKLVFLLSFGVFTLSLSSQNFDDIDSLLVDRDIENYSIRILTNYKVNKFSLKNHGSRLKFVPNNKHGLGFGFANKKLILDLAFNLKNPNKEETRRFDLQGTTILKKKHFVNVYAQTYKGFEAKNNFNEPYVFRSDLRSINIGFNYLHTLDNVEFSYSLLKAGLSEKEHENVFITGGLGLFGGFDYFSADSSILSEESSSYFNEEANIKRYQSVAIGVLAGFVSYYKLPENITATLNVMPGIGITHKKITLKDGGYIPSNPMIYKLDFLVGLAYNLKQYYVSLTYSNGLYATDFDYDNKYRLNLSKAKLAFGYKFKHKK